MFVYWIQFIQHCIVLKDFVPCINITGLGCFYWRQYVKIRGCCCAIGMCEVVGITSIRTTVVLLLSPWDRICLTSYRRLQKDTFAHTIPNVVPICSLCLSFLSTYLTEIYFGSGRSECSTSWWPSHEANTGGWVVAELGLPVLGGYTLITKGKYPSHHHDCPLAIRL